MLDRRSYLKAAGALAAGAGVTAGAATLVSNDDPNDHGNVTNDSDSIDPPAEPSADAEVIDIDYERYERPEDVYRVWTGEENGSYSFVDNRTYTGSRALRCVIDEGQNNGSNATYWFPAERGTQPDEVYQRSVIALSDEWEMEAEDVCRFWCTGLNDEAGPAGSGGDGPPTGDDGWSNLVAVTTRGTSESDEYNLAAYTYHMDQLYSAGELEVVEAPIRAGEWFELETYVQMNAVSDGEAVPDGEIRYWVNGELVYERTDFRWTTTEEQGVEHSGPIVRYGGNENAPRDLSIYYDEHRIVLGDIPPVPSVDETDDFVGQNRWDEYEGRVTFASGDERTEYALYCDGEIVQTTWSNVDGQRATYNGAVSITDDEYAVVEATIVPDTADGYVYDGEIVAVAANPDPAELWIDGSEVSIDDYPDRPEDE